MTCTPLAATCTTPHTHCTISSTQHRTASQSGRSTRPTSALDALACSIHECGPFIYEVGGPELGGTEAERMLLAPFSGLDKRCVRCEGPFGSARRVVLTEDGHLVAAAIVEVNSDQHIFKVQ